MLHETSFIAMIVVDLVLAFVFGALANRLKISLLVGYLVAGTLLPTADSTLLGIALGAD